MGGRALNAREGSLIHCRTYVTDWSASRGPVDGPAAYFITFACYGVRFHGDPKGSVDRFHNVPGTARVEANSRRRQREQRLAKNASVIFDVDQRQLVLRAIEQHCRYREWVLHAGHVRSNHAHVVIWADVAPEEVMSQLKRYASRALNVVADRPRR
jgi:hypothetical protein